MCINPTLSVIAIFKAKSEIQFYVKLDFQILVHLYIFKCSVSKKTHKTPYSFAGCHPAITDHSFISLIRSTGCGEVNLIQKRVTKTSAEYDFQREIKDTEIINVGEEWAVGWLINSSQIHEGL